MSKIIYDIIKEYSDADIILPSETIEEIIEIIADELNVSDYIKEVRFVSESLFGGLYDPYNKIISFDYTTYDDYFNNTLKQNLLYLLILLHEINHAKQLKFYSENSFNSLNDPLDKYKYLINDEFKKIGKLTKGIIYHDVYSLDEIEYAKKLLGKDFDSDFPEKFAYLYDIHHHRFIPEREADIEAYNYVLNLLNVNSDSSELISFYKNELNKRKLELYKNYDDKIENNPIKNYLYYFGYDELNEKIMNLKGEINSTYPELPLDIRMEYGLDITPDEYNRIRSDTTPDDYKQTSFEMTPEEYNRLCSATSLDEYNSIQDILYNDGIERKLKSKNNN